MIEVKIIIASTRPGRKGPAIASWVYDAAKKHEAFNVELVDLAVINLPFLDEPNHPRIKQYTQPHTKAWSRLIDAADAVVIVTAEYNYSFPAPLKNALDYLYNEWNYKPVAFVSYGGISAGTRAVQMLKQVVTTLKMMPLVESVNIPFFAKYFNGEGKFVPDDSMEKAADEMFVQLHRLAENFRMLRNKT